MNLLTPNGLKEKLTINHDELIKRINNFKGNKLKQVIEELTILKERLPPNIYETFEQIIWNTITPIAYVAKNKWYDSLGELDHDDQMKRVYDHLERKTP